METERTRDVLEFPANPQVSKKCDPSMSMSVHSDLSRGGRRGNRNECPVCTRASGKDLPSVLARSLTLSAIVRMNEWDYKLQM
jgi:hypothetical protein